MVSKTGPERQNCYPQYFLVAETGKSCKVRSMSKMYQEAFERSFELQANSKLEKKENIQ